MMAFVGGLTEPGTRAARYPRSRGGRMSIRFRISAAVAFGMALFALGCGESVDQGSTELGVASTRCAFSQGYWKSQTRWPVSSLHLGTVSYTEAQLRAI